MMRSGHSTLFTWMKTKADLLKQYLASMDAIRAKRTYAQKLMQEAEEELIEARLLLEDIERDEDRAD